MQEKDGAEYDSDYDEIDTYGEDKLEDKVYYGSDTTTEFEDSDEEDDVINPDGTKTKTVKIYKIENPYLETGESDDEIARYIEDEKEEEYDEEEESGEEEQDENAMEFDDIRVSDKIKAKSKSKV